MKNTQNLSAKLSLLSLIVASTSQAVFAASVTTTVPSGFTLDFNALLQSRWNLLTSSTNPSQQTFDIPLARLAFSGTALSPKVNYLFQFQTSTLANNNDVTLLDAWLQYSANEYFVVQAGRMILPYSRQFFTNPGQLLFSDLSTADLAFDLPRSLGVGLSGKVGWITYYATLTNSIRALDGLGQNNTGSGLAALGRIEADILSPYGYLESSPSEVTAPQLSVGIAASENPVDETSTFQNLVAGETTYGVTADVGFRVNRLSTQAAVYFRRATGVTAPRWDHGYYAQAGWFVVPEALELATRYSALHFGEVVAPGAANNSSEWLAGANYYFKGHSLKIQSQYGRIGQAGQTDNRFQLQAQILF